MGVSKNPNDVNVIDFALFMRRMRILVWKGDYGCCCGLTFYVGDEAGRGIKLGRRQGNP